MSIKNILHTDISKALLNLFQIENVEVELQKTKPDFEGDFTIVTFPLVKLLKKSPDVIAMELGNELMNNSNLFESFNIVKGFLNLKLKDSVFLVDIEGIKNGLDHVESKNETVMVEYSSPNTNKPLHLGHIRNNLLGFSIANILKEDGYNVIKTQIINDRGIHICKSMLAWEKFGNGATPESTSTKGDKLVGNYYVEFDKQYKKEINELKEQGLDEEVAKKQAPSIIEAQNMLLDWENEDADV